MIQESNKSIGTGGQFRVFVSFAIAMVLSIVELPDSISAIRPDLIALVLIFWCLHQPQFVGILTAFVVGLLADVLYFGVLGQHAIAKLSVAYITLRFVSRNNHMTTSVQTLVVLFLLLLNASIIGIVDIFAQNQISMFLLWTSALTGTLLWIIFIQIRNFRASL